MYKQKVKHLLYEHQNSITAFKSNAELGLKLQQDEMQAKTSDLGRDKHALKLEMKEQVQYSSFSHQFSLSSAHWKQVQDPFSVPLTWASGSTVFFCSMQCNAMSSCE